VFVVRNFIGGTIGSALASIMWGLGGWPVVMAATGAIVLLALLVWAVQRRRALALAPNTTGLGWATEARAHGYKRPAGCIMNVPLPARVSGHA
jgi:hypothetical protein